MRILVIDDDRHLVCAIQRGLKGHEVDGATDAQTGIDHVQAADEAGAPFDVVLCDFVMPTMSGLDVIATLRSQHEPPILLLMSGLDDLDAASCDGVLAKPFRPGEVLRMIEDIKERRSRALTRRLPCCHAMIA